MSREPDRPAASEPSTQPSDDDGSGDESGDARQHIVFQKSVTHVQERVPAEAIAEAAREFEALSQGEGQRLVRLFNDSYERHSWMQVAEQRAQHVALYAGLGIATLLSLGLIGGAIYSIGQGHPWAAGAFLGTATVSMVAGFIDASTRRRRADGGDHSPRSDQGEK